MTTNAFRRWMRVATVEQQEALAAALETSRATLYQYTSEHRQMSPTRAREVEAFTVALHKSDKAAPEPVYRTDLNAECRACEFASKCLGARAVLSDFQVIEGESK